MTILVTGCAGFIGSNFVHTWLTSSDEQVINIDKLTYAGNLANLDALKDDPRHVFVQGDIGDTTLVPQLLAQYKPRAVLNFAAESHVDRSIHGPGDFIQTNVMGTFNLLESVRAYWQDLPAAEKEAFRFLHVSTDEVYGTLSPSDQKLRAQQPVLSQQSRQRPLGSCMAPHLRLARADHQLQQQLRPVPLP
jgi:dTDP-glucose 4,6-dehydratase